MKNKKLMEITKEQQKPEDRQKYIKLINANTDKLNCVLLEFCECPWFSQRFLFPIENDRARVALKAAFFFSWFLAQKRIIL